MNNQIIACFDVYYKNDQAKACCIVFKTVPAEKIFSTYCQVIEPVSDYISGEFYRRELPCILRVYEKIREDIDLIIIDGFVTLKNDKKGLGAHLFESLDKKLPVIGVAKTYFRGCENYVEIYRGKSSKPLYISSIGIDLNYSAEFVKNLNGIYRIPDILKKVDQLSRKNTLYPPEFP